jgi:hypothetical protein
MHRHYTILRTVPNTNFILSTSSWAERHRVYSGHYPRKFGASKNAQNAETKCQSGAVPILLLIIPVLTTGSYSSHNILQGLNPRPWLLKTLVYHSPTSAVVKRVETCHKELFNSRLFCYVYLLFIFNGFTLCIYILLIYLH